MKTSIKLKFRASTDKSGAKEGTLYFQVIHNRVSRQISTSLRILGSEWDVEHETVVASKEASADRKPHIESVHSQLRDIRKRIEAAVASVGSNGETYTTDDVVEAYNGMLPDVYSLFSIVRRHAERLYADNKIGSSNKFKQLLNSLRRFRDGKDLSIFDLNADLVEAYDAWMRLQNLKRNTRSFYHCRLRTIYNKMVAGGIIEPASRSPFENVFTGMDATTKRAISKDEIFRIQQLDLSANPAQDFARIIFLLSFYLRGMSFIDMAYLRKSDIRDGILTYCRHKTGQQLSIKWEQQMQDVVDALPKSETDYLLPIITKEGAEGRKQYENKMKSVNRRLKSVAQKAGISVPLSTYWSRHSWSTIARDNDVPISIISKALGHNSIVTTQIYLDSISNDKVDEANRLVISGF